MVEGNTSKHILCPQPQLSTDICVPPFPLRLAKLLLLFLFPRPVRCFFSLTVPQMKAVPQVLAHLAGSDALGTPQLLRSRGRAQAMPSQSPVLKLCRGEDLSAKPGTRVRCPHRLFWLWFSASEG